MIMTRKQQMTNILSGIVGRDFDEQMLLYSLPLMNLLWIWHRRHLLAERFFLPPFDAVVTMLLTIVHCR